MSAPFLPTVTILGHVAFQGSRAAKKLRRALNKQKSALEAEAADLPSLAANQHKEARDLVNRATCLRGYVGRAKE